MRLLSVLPYAQAVLLLTESHLRFISLPEGLRLFGVRMDQCVGISWFVIEQRIVLFLSDEGRFGLGLRL